MGSYKGKITPVSRMLAEARAAGPLRQSPIRSNGQPVTVTRDAARAALVCRGLLQQGDSLTDAWRFGILQTIDYYTTYHAIGGPLLGAKVFTTEPPPTGETCVDAAFAALAEHLAQRDHWAPPTWAQNPDRVAQPPWYVAPGAENPGYLNDQAHRVTPEPFSKRGVFICWKDLERA